MTSVLGVHICHRTRPEALDALRGLLAGNRAHSVYFVHAATANLAFEDPGFRAVLNRGDLVLNDGIGVRLAARSNGLSLEQNLVGTDLLPLLFAGPFERPLRVYLLGGRSSVAKRAAICIRDQFPEIEVVGSGHGYFEYSEEGAVIERINAAAPDLLLVGMGNPRQEAFIDRHLPRLRCHVAIGVGGLFDHFCGDLRRGAPWVRRWGLEWLQLLIQQPQKWRRYLLGNPKFLWRALRGVALEWAGSAAVLIISFLISLLAAEAIVRLVRPQIVERYPEGLYLPSATRQYRLRPHFSGVFRYPEFETFVRINAQGLRAARDYGPPAPDTHRILAIGDSFTMGYSVAEDQTWVRVLESLLGPRYEVINAGVPGYSTWQELDYLREEGLALAPRTVLLGLFLGNDISDNSRSTLPVELQDGNLIASHFRTGMLPFAFRLALARHSHLYHLVHRKPNPAPENELGWQATAGLIDRMARLCRLRSIRFVVVVISSAPSANRRMLELCRRAGVEPIDLFAHMTGPGLYFPQDGHWTPRGNILAARAIFEYLCL